MIFLLNAFLLKYFNFHLENNLYLTYNYIYHIFLCSYNTSKDFSTEKYNT